MMNVNIEILVIEKCLDQHVFHNMGYLMSMIQDLNRDRINTKLRAGDLDQVEKHKYVFYRLSCLESE